MPNPPKSKQPVAAQSPEKGPVRAKPRLPEPARLALYQILERRSNPTADLTDVLSAEARHASGLQLEALLTELEVARAFNHPMPESLPEAIDLMEGAIQQITGATKSAILLYHEQSGTFTCLNDERNPHTQPRELTVIADDYLAELLQPTRPEQRGRNASPTVIQSFLFDGDRFMGMVAIVVSAASQAQKQRRQALLDALTPYLVNHVLGYLRLRKLIQLPAIQQCRLALLNAMNQVSDRPAILHQALHALADNLGFDGGQAILLNEHNGDGLIQDLYWRDGNVSTHFDNPSDLKVTDFKSWLGLFQSIAGDKPYLYIKGNTLGDKPLEDLFHVPEAASAVILPLQLGSDQSDTACFGAITLFSDQSQFLKPDVAAVLEAALPVVAHALDRAVLLEKAYALATCDELTGLLNRRGFYQHLESEVERACRYQTATCLAILDLDHFKRLNDTHGHLTGDRVLVGFADFIRQNLRRSDVIARFGGEEFALILPETTVEAAGELLDRIRQRIESTTFKGASGEVVSLSFSAGVADVTLAHCQGCERPTLISNTLALADERLYIAKSAGRNQIVTGL
jgi:diguanylate cyclase (GGDEF)-like protein